MVEIGDYWIHVQCPTCPLPGVDAVVVLVLDGVDGVAEAEAPAVGWLVFHAALARGELSPPPWSHITDSPIKANPQTHTHRSLGSALPVSIRYSKIPRLHTSMRLP